ncbi:MAG: polysaccharide lyase family 8 super-sandwich domain-containing protein, partial [Proteiniphilum sp.]
QSVLSRGEKNYDNVDWVFHDGIGYLFPQKTSVGLQNDRVTGSWWNISKQTSTDKSSVTKDIFKLWIDHGKRPSDKLYAYIVVPATTPEKMRQLRSESHIDILMNSPEIQAVRNKDLDMTQAVFYRGGKISMDENLQIKSDNQGIVMIKMKEGRLAEISVSDPSRELERFNLSVTTRIDKKGSNFWTVWNEDEQATHISIALPQDNYAGDSVTIQLNE